MSERESGLARRDAARADLALAGGEDARIELVDYDPAWPGSFDAEATRLAGVAPGYEWHHIGSTAVSGLAAKPIVDIMAVADRLDALAELLAAQAGYAFPVAYNATLIRRRWLCRPSAARRTHHLHLVADREVLTRHLRFRDALRAHAELAAEYATLKRKLAAELADDREAYTAAKTVFVQRVLADL